MLNYYHSGVLKIYSLITDCLKNLNLGKNYLKAGPVNNSNEEQ